MRNRTDKDFDISMIREYERAKSHITRRLVNYEQNKDMLKERPYKLIEDLAVIYTIDVSGVINDGMATIRLSNEIMNHFKITVDELDVIASENTKQRYGLQVEDIMEYLEMNIVKDIAELLEIEEEQAREMFKDTYQTEIPMYFVTNERKIYGAASILDESVQDELAEKIGERFCVIPSSVHEVIVIPFNGDFDELEMLNEMVRSVNLEIVSSEEMLSDKMYIVDAVNHVFLRMDRAKEYFQVLDEKKKIERKREESVQEENNKSNMKYRTSTERHSISI